MLGGLFFLLFIFRAPSVSPLRFGPNAQPVASQDDDASRHCREFDALLLPVHRLSPGS